MIRLVNYEDCYGCRNSMSGDKTRGRGKLGGYGTNPGDRWRCPSLGTDWAWIRIKVDTFHGDLGYGLKESNEGEGGHQGGQCPGSWLGKLGRW